jgi:phosphatidylglycerophosphatase A
VTPVSTRLATCFGIGWTPWAPGTIASAVALPIGFGLAMFGLEALAMGAILATALGVWACGLHARKVGLFDPSECVLDEVAGQWFALVPIVYMGRGGDWRPYGVAFLLFRLFDILKPWPICAAERLPGGWGVMMDDVLAGLSAAIFLSATLWIGLV